MNSNTSDRAVSRGFVDHAALFITVATTALILATILHYSLINFTALVNHQLPDNAHFQMADWLINYQGGFVRRGLIGQLIYFVSDNPYTLMYTVLLLQISIYIAAFIFTLKLFFLKKRSLSWCIFLFSPMFFIEFEFINELGSFFKEIIVYFALSLYLLGLHNNKRWERIIAIVAYILGAFSHELISLCIVFFVWPIWQAIREQNRRDLWPELIVLISISGISTLTAFFFNGNPETASAICQSLTVKGMHPSICGGSIQWISRDTQAAFSHIKYLEQQGYVLWPYMLASILGSLPLLAIKKPNTLSIWLVLALVAMSPLFILAYDYGRWLSIFFSLSFINFFYLSIHQNIELYRIPAILIPIYCFTWSVNHFIATNLDFGLLDPIIFAFFGKM